jgi:elongator complex protein 4
MQTIAALQSHKPEAFDLAFKLKSNRFVIEKLHLPPELQDGDSSEISMSCSSTASGGGGNKSLDF